MTNILELQPNTIIADDYESQLFLSAWVGFQSRQGPYNSKDTDEASTGLVKCYVSGKEVDYVKISTAEQVNAIRYLVDHSVKVRDALFDGLLKQMPELQDCYADAIPEIKNLGDFKQYIGLANIHVMPADKDGYAYIGYELGCDWEEEHGIGVMMHKDRVVEFGQADTAFNQWITFDDNGTTEIETKKWNEVNDQAHSTMLIKEDKRPWWKFWQ
ncbi:MAG: hypothetical protein RL660_1729 [Bacteroidota bacterium]